MPSFARSFSEQLRRVVVPVLSEAGFAFDGSRTFRRFPEGHACVHIVNFQLGERFMEGKFTVNLAVYDPADCAAQVEPKKALEYHSSTRRRQRLGYLIPRRLGALAWVPLVGVLFRPRDTWWPAGRETATVHTTDAIVRYGLAWLERNTPDNARS